MAKPSPKQEEGNGLRQEVLGIVLFALALYSGISLVSSAASANWGGAIGEFVSWALLGSIGYASYVFPIILIVISVQFLMRRFLSFRVVVPVSFLVFVLASSAFLSLVSAAETAGGAVGTFLSRMLTDLAGATGAAIFLSAVILITLLVATGISVVQIGGKVIPPAAMLFKSMMEKLRQRNEGVEEEEEPIAESAPAPKKEPKKEEKPKAAPAITAPKIHNKRQQEEPSAEPLDFAVPKGNYQLPPLTLLDPVPKKSSSIDDKALLENSKILEKKLMDFGVEGRVLEVRPGPVVTMYEFEPAAGVKVGRITNLSDDLALAMKAMSIRIIAPIPGKSVVGIEVPNQTRDTILLREMMECPLFAKSRSRVTLALGKDISGAPYVSDLAKMPHLLVAGATGTGKSVAVNAMILSVLFKATPEDVRFLMVDPKMLELSAYEGIPHLITPVITDPKKAANALRHIVAEMGRRYKMMAERGAKNIEKFNQMVEEGGKPDEKKLPFIVVIIDELADLMMTSGKDVEECLVRLSQMARASGIHLLIATQRPSVDVVTGLIKTNFPARIAFQLPSKTDSRTILDAGGAETLLGQGDMLFLPPGTSKLLRVHGAYVSEPEIKKVTDFWRAQGLPAYEEINMEDPEPGLTDEEADLGEEFLRRYDEAVALAAQQEMISTSYIQRRFRIGYNTAARIIEKMEKEGVVGPAQGSRPREVLLRKQH
ncbi:DNA translocase FtsK [uncultured bacterium]|nr:DNA translocase FtsK [uncultured bacterium]